MYILISSHSPMLSCSLDLTALVWMLDFQCFKHTTVYSSLLTSNGVSWVLNSLYSTLLLYFIGCYWLRCVHVGCCCVLGVSKMQHALSLVFRHNAYLVISNAFLTDVCLMIASVLESLKFILSSSQSCVALV